MTKNKFSVVSLFSGAGGLDLGFKQVGFRLVWANDIDSDCVLTYKKNIGDEVVCGDVSEFEASVIPDCDVMIGGFPCQGFSVANTKRSVLDKRNTMYLQYVRILKAKRPKVFLAENVKGILTLGNGLIIKAIIKDFSDAGYDVKYKLINAADYGVPQTRERVIIVGVRKDLNCKYKFPEPTHDKEGRNGRLPWISVKQALEGIPDPDGPEADSVPNNEYSKYKVTVKNFTGHRMTDSEKPSPTILARGNGGGGVCAIPHYNGIRRLSVRESATIQCFPINFVFVGARGSTYRQVGNAVPVLLSRSIAYSIMELLEGCNIYE